VDVDVSGIRVTLVDGAGNWLQEFLRANGPTLSSVVKESAEKIGFRESTLKRAMATIGGQVIPVPGTTKTQWVLPGQVETVHLGKIEISPPLAQCTCPCSCGARTPVREEVDVRDLAQPHPDVVETVLVDPDELDQAEVDDPHVDKPPAKRKKIRMKARPVKAFSAEDPKEPEPTVVQEPAEEAPRSLLEVARELQARGPYTVEELERMTYRGLRVYAIRVLGIPGGAIKGMPTPDLIQLIVDRQEQQQDGTKDEEAGR
jgi:hypothetical protein